MSICINPAAHQRVHHAYGSWGVGYIIDEIGDVFIKVAFPQESVPAWAKDKPEEHVRTLRRSSVFEYNH